MRMELIRTSVKLMVFLAISVLCLVMVVNTLTKPMSGEGRGYRAQFTDAIGLTTGADVLMAGVRVGRVTGVDLADGLATVSFDLGTEQRIPADATVAIRYSDLLGGRNGPLLPGPGGPAAPAEQRPDEVIPVARTRPAVDLTNLLNGFTPLFAVLDPAEVNQLTGELVAIFQGQGGTVQSLLTRTISVTHDLGSRRQLVSEVLRNLTTTVDFALGKRQDFQELLDGLNRLMAGLAEDRGQISEALDAATGLAESLGGLVEKTAPELPPLLASANGAADTLIGSTEQFTAALARTPSTLDNLMRAADYGSWVSVYLCNLNLEARPIGKIDLSGGPHSEVCR